MTKHTPGPWKAEDNMSNEHKGKGWIVRGVDGKPLTGWGSITTTEANARLIAAAPDLLAVCEAELEVYDGMDRSRLRVETLARIAALRAAIAKARGEPISNPDYAPTPDADF